MAREYRERIQCDNCGALNSPRNRKCYNCKQPLRGSILRVPIVRRRRAPAAPTPPPTPAPPIEIRCKSCNRVVSEAEFVRNRGLCDGCAGAARIEPAPTGGFMAGVFRRGSRTPPPTRTARARGAIGRLGGIFGTPKNCPNCGADLTLAGDETSFTKCDRCGRRYNRRGLKRIRNSNTQSFIIMFFIAPFLIFIPFVGIWLAAGLILFNIGNLPLLPKKPLDIGKAAVKYGFRTFGSLVISFGFFSFNMLLGFIVLFFFYLIAPSLTLPKDQEKREERKNLNILLWVLKIILSIVFVVFTYITFSWKFAPVVILTGAFFTWSDIAVGFSIFTIAEGLEKREKNLNMIDKAGFALIALFAIVFTVFFSGIGEIGTMIFYFYLLLLVSAFIFGIMVDAGSRPMLGLPLIILMMIVLTTAYPEVLGRQVFGAWWPQVQTFGETMWAPIAPMFDQITSGMSDAWLMISNPAEYYRLQLERQQAGQSVITPGGTFKSIEILTFDMMGTTVLEPTEPLLGYVELENQGEFDAGDISLNISATWKDPDNPKTIEVVGNIGRMECSGDVTGDIGDFGICTWTGVTYPNEIKTASFTFDKDSWGHLGQCKNDDLDPCPSCDAEECPQATYKDAMTNVKINLRYDYDYKVNVSIPIDAIKQELYMELLENREITLREVTSEYTGGPVKATIKTFRQPLREGDKSLIVVSIVNEGGGILNNISNLTVYVHKNLNPEEFEMTTFKVKDATDPDKKEDGCGSWSDGTGDWEDFEVLSCNHEFPILSTDDTPYKRVAFYIEPTIGASDRRSLLIVGLADYSYSKEDSRTLTMSSFPPQ